MTTAGPVARAQAALDRLNEVHQRANCLADVDDEAVLAAAATAPPGVLHGEPVTVKDWIDVAGFRCCGGEVAHADRRPAVDATVVARVRAAGGVVVAKTAVLVDSDRFGRVLHPHDALRSPGGSSSGEAVAVASGAVRLGIGSDSGGSIRVPAAWCGIVGMKPSSGLVPTTGHFPVVGDRVDGRTVVGPLASSVDLAWDALTVMAGPDGLDGGVAPVPLGDPGAVDVSSLRIAVGVPGEVPVSPAVARALERARELVLAAGARDAGPPPAWVDEARRVTVAYWERSGRSGDQVERDLEDWDAFRTQVLAQTSDADVLLTPVVAEMAPLHRPMRRDDYLFCLPPSLTGAPALSVPVGDGAVQVVAQRWSDHVAVAVARVLEAAQIGERATGIEPA